MAAGYSHTVGLKPDGTVVAAGDNRYGQSDVGSWRGITQVAAGRYHTVGLETDGTVLAVGDNRYGQSDVGSWRGITQVAAGNFHTVGLTTDGTVVAVGDNYYGQCQLWSLSVGTSSFAPPRSAILTSPISSALVTNPVTYTWEAVSGASWYYLWVNDSSGNKIKQWYTATQCDCCGSGTGECSVRPDVALAFGDAAWWIQTWNSAGYGPWSSGMSFTIEAADTSIPGAASLTFPSATITDTMPVYMWNAVSDATWYFLWVNDISGNTIKTWYTAAQCGCENGAGECSVRPDVALAFGDATWWIQTWNNAGYGPWSSGKAFTVAE